MCNARGQEGGEGGAASLGEEELGQANASVLHLDRREITTQPQPQPSASQRSFASTECCWEKLLESISPEEKVIGCVSLSISLSLKGTSLLHIIPFHLDSFVVSN